MPRRISDILNELEKQNLDGLLIFSDANIAYLTNYLSRESILLVSPSGNVFITDSRYTQEARHYLKNLASVVTINGSLSETIALTLRNHKLKTVGFEAAFLSYARFINLRKNTKAQKISLRPVIGLIEKYRQIKNPEEIKAIRKSCHISLKTLAFIKNKIRPGKTELEIAAEIERFIRCNGARMSSFEIIVASGPHSAYPHHQTSNRSIKKHDIVLIDMGVDALGFKSDLTRVFFLGKMNLLEKRVFNTVYQAQQRALQAIKPGVSIRSIDLLARNYIKQQGFGAYFGHSLGHGVGLEVHEEPTISAKTEGTIKENMVFTIEPGIYLPGQFGVRIEDMVVVTKKGCEVISGSLN